MCGRRKALMPPPPPRPPARLLLVLMAMAVARCAGGQSCEQQVASIRITKEEYDPVNQALIRVCEGEIRVNKCDGRCQSSLQPSFNSPTGFLKVRPWFTLLTRRPWASFSPSPERG